MNKRNYWGYRIDTARNKFFMDELNMGRLRQGWGYDERQNLRNLQLDEGASRNLPMFKKVKKGDILLIPQLPSWDQVAIVEATEDWSTGYEFKIDKKYGDYGHIFPAKYIKSFTRSNENVSGNLRSTLRNPSRFWNINHCQDDINRLLLIEQSDLEKRQDHASRLMSTVGAVYNEVFDEQIFASKIYGKLLDQFTSEEWEFALVKGLQELFPYYLVERVGGKQEVNHGTDILIRLPSPLSDYEYAIAIQVKDYTETVGPDVITQINKAVWWESEGLKLIDKWVIITRAEKNVNMDLINSAGDVKIMFASELKELLGRIAKAMLGLK